MKQQSLQSIKMLGLFLAINFTALGLGGWLTSFTVKSWYLTIAKPVWTPPSWVFPVVWPLLYLLFAVALWTLWKSAQQQRANKDDTGDFKTAFNLLYIQLVLNLGWSASFFTAQTITLGLIVIVTTWLLLLFTLKVLSRQSKLAMALLIPYTLWLTYALALNTAIFIMNI